MNLRPRSRTDLEMLAVADTTRDVRLAGIGIPAGAIRLGIRAGVIGILDGPLMGGNEPAKSRLGSFLSNINIAAVAAAKRRLG